MTSEAWSALAAVAVALIGGGWFGARAMKRRTDAEAVKTMAEARQVDVATNVTLVDAAMAFGKDMEKRFREVYVELADLRGKYNGAVQDVREAITERHQCEAELEEVRARLDAIERRNSERDAAVEKILWPTPPPMDAIKAKQREIREE